MSRAAHRLVSLCFFLSGAAGLVYEVVWARRLGLFLGISTYAHAAVIAAFLAGLAGGALLFGRIADRHPRPLRLYAWLEGAIGLYAAATPWLLAGLERLFAAASQGLSGDGAGPPLLRFAAALLALLIPTTLMGGTLPLVVRRLASGPPRVGSTVGRLYGVNTLGATAGALVAGYLLLPELGVRGSLWVTAAVNLGVALLAAWLDRRDEAAAGGEAAPEPFRPEIARPSPVRRLLLSAFALSGFAALVYQIAWIRALTLVIGASVYAFSVTLATYLAGIALGSFVYSRWLARLRPGLAAAGGLEVAVGLGALGGLWAIGRLPALFLAGFEGGAGSSFALLQLLAGGLCAAVLLVPSLLLGVLFPLFTGLSAGDASRVGRSVGLAYAVNTAGTVLGAVAGGLLVLPALGIQGSVVLGTALHVSVGIGLLLASEASRPRRWVPAGVGALAWVALLAALPSWDRLLMTSGAYSRPEAFGSPQRLRELVGSERLLFYDEGIEGTVAVVENAYQRRLVIDGKTDATSRGDLPTQVMLGQLPMLMRPGSREVLLVGLGSGITAASVLSHAGIERLDVVELSPGVVEAASYFEAENRGVLEDPRLRLIVGDARHVLHSRAGLYDAIVSEPSNPWISGVSNLFTREAFELARSRLRAGGLMAQWFHTYAMGRDDLRSVLRTFQAVFPHVSAWMPLDGDLVLVGSDTRHALDLDHVAAVMAGDPVADDLRRAGIGSPDELVRTFLIGGPDLRTYVAGAPLNTDDRPRIEFSAPRYLYRQTAGEILGDLIEHLESGYRRAPVELAPRSGSAAGPTEIPGMGVAVRAPLSADGWRFEWSVSRRAFRDLEGALKVGVTSRRSIAWRAAGATIHLEAVGLSAPPGAAAARLHALALLTGPATATGTLTAGPAGAAWAAGSADGEAEVAVSWLCEGVAGPRRYGVLRRGGEPGDAAEAAELAGRFDCR